MGSGKSAVGRALAIRLGTAHVDTDELIADRAGATIPEIFDRAGEGGFREAEAAALRLEALERLELGVRLGFGDARYLREATEWAGLRDHPRFEQLVTALEGGRL